MRDGSAPQHVPRHRGPDEFGTMAPQQRLTPVARRDVAALVGAVVFLAVGFVAIYAVVKVADVENGTVLAALLIVPALLYMLLSGRITELKGPGGLEVKLSEAAHQSIAEQPGPELGSLPIEEVESVAKGGPQSLTGRLEQLDIGSRSS